MRAVRPFGRLDRRYRGAPSHFLLWHSTSLDPLVCLLALAHQLVPVVPTDWRGLRVAGDLLQPGGNRSCAPSLTMSAASARGDAPPVPSVGVHVGLRPCCPLQPAPQRSSPGDEAMDEVYRVAGRSWPAAPPPRSTCASGGLDG